ncbi:pectinesterase family protein [Duncaniella muris]|uniref:pectinesterase family protein n=1 Tax=Duncaniella muris TaxID=2094150 RepID=UPI002714F2FA|nr:pectinesterase family protein [Duncaniella muris]
MIKRIRSMVLVLACLLGVSQANAEFRNFKLNLGEEGLLTADEIAGKQSVSFGVVVNADGSLTRVDASDTSANLFFSGNYHSEHGCTGSTLKFAVDGPVKITLGTCQFGTGDATVTNAAGETVAFLNSNNGTCYHGNRTDNVVSAYYKGGAAQLTLTPKNYTPYIAVEVADPSEIVEDATVSFDFGEYAGAGVLPAGEKVEIGKTFTIPSNYTIYQEGKTLVGWTDGAKNYEIGEIVTVNGDLTLTPRFVSNTVSLADRTEALTLKWNFRRDQGVPTVAWEGKTGVFMVAQAKIGTEIIDVQLPISTSPGKFNNGSNTDWAQVNSGTTFSVPSCKGAIISFESYNLTNSKTPVTTIDGQTIKSSKNPSFQIAGNAETVDIVAGSDIGYMRYVQVVLPVAESTGGKTFDNVAGTLTWAVGNESEPSADSAINGAYSTAGVNAGSSLKVETATYFDQEMAKYTPESDNLGTVAGAMIEYRIKAAKGITFTPSEVKYDAVKVGTDNATFSYSYVLDGTESTITKVDASTVLRNNGANAATAQLGHSVTIPEKAVNEFAFRFYISNTASTKNIALSNIIINGVFNGTTEEVALYTLNASVSPEEAAALTVYPKAAEYEAGSEISLSVNPNFGFHFVNWTDASGNVVSTDPQFTYTLNENSDLTANFKSVATYELKYDVEGGANTYMVEVSPAPTVIDGKNMYETGSKVTLKATSNSILTFNNWNDGTTFPEVSLTMDSDKEMTAVYSAIDYIIGWDFYRPGNNGRPADFASTPENESVALVLYNPETKETSGWLDKSTEAAGGYESLLGAAVNWTKGSADGDIGHNYFQTTAINARDFSNIKVSADLLYNYNAYTRVILEYSLDGEEWKEVADVNMPVEKTVYPIAGTLPAEADHAETLYLRWRPDLSSSINGTKSANDGTAIANIYLTADAAIYDDGTAPVVLSTVPADGAEGASATGKIVINFDEKVKLTDNAKATLNGESIELAVSGKTVSASYRNLAYATEQTFELAANSVCDPAGNTLTSAVTVKFTTMERPTVEKALYHHEVSTTEEFLAALEKANTRQNTGERYRIYLHNGTYDLGNRCLTAISGNNISIIGQSEEGVIIVNHPQDEGIGVTATLFNTSTGLYLQDITLKNAYNYLGTTGRAVCLQDKGDKTIAKNVKLLSYQDTYYSNKSTSRFYWEDSEIHGTVDFLCGGGDVYYNRVNLVLEKRSGNVIAAPNGQLKYGYVFLDCEINAVAGGESTVNGAYTLGRPWGADCRAQYINTRMNVTPSAAGWAEMGKNKPLVFAEYNSTDKNGTQIDLSSRKVKFDGGTQASAILTKAQADELSIENVMGGSDNWNPLAFTEQAPAPTNVTINENGEIKWDRSDYALCWAVCKDGKIIAFVTEPTHTVEAEVSRAAAPVYTVRAANEMGGLGEEVKAVYTETTGITDITADQEVVSTVYYNIQGIAVSPNTTGLLIKVETLASGATRTSKVIVK